MLIGIGIIFIKSLRPQSCIAYENLSFPQTISYGQTVRRMDILNYRVDSLQKKLY